MDSAQIKKVAILGVAALGIFFVVKNMGATPEPVVQTVAPIVKEAPKVEILLATDNIPLGTRLSSSHFSFQPWPKDAVREGMIVRDDRPEADGELMGAITRADIFAGDPINENKLIRADDRGVMAALISPGMRAVTTRISVETAAGGFIQPGDRVDVLVTEKFDIRTDNTEQQGGIIRNEAHMSNILFENVQVLAIDQTFATDPEGDAYVIGSTATFELSPGDATILQEAQSAGDISLTLRGITGSRSPARSAARTAVYKQPEQSPDITIYRSGAPERVIVKGQ